MSGLYYVFYLSIKLPIGEELPAKASHTIFIQFSMASTLTSVPPKAVSLPVLDSNGASHLFSTLYTTDGHNQQTLVIFIRHFFCGSCKEYVCALSEKDGMTPSELSVANKRLIIIGCGQANLIEQYIKDTKCPFPIYADPTQQLYDAFGMIRTLNLGEKKPDYIKSSFVSNLAKSALSQLSAGTSMFQGGDIHQVGGEYLIDERGDIIWSHNMDNTRDHVEVKELRKVLALD
jgi:peroxiredoxin